MKKSKLKKKLKKQTEIANYWNKQRYRELCRLENSEARNRAFNAELSKAQEELFATRMAAVEAIASPNIAP